MSSNDDIQQKLKYIESQIKFKPITDELCFGFMPGRVFPDWGATSPELVLSEEDEKNQLSWIM